MSTENTLIHLVDIFQEKQGTSLGLRPRSSEDQEVHSGRQEELLHDLFHSLMRKFVLLFAKQLYLKVHSSHLPMISKLKSRFPKRNRSQRRTNNTQSNQKDLQKRRNLRRAKKNQLRRSNLKSHPRSQQGKSSHPSTQRDLRKKTNHQSSRLAKINPKSNRRDLLSSKTNLRSHRRNLPGKISLRSNLSSHRWRTSTTRNRAMKSRNPGRIKPNLTRTEEL